jgi:integrase
MELKYYLFRRPDRSPYYFVQFNDALGRALTQRSTGETNRDKALLKAAAMAAEGILPARPKSRRREADTLGALAGYADIVDACRAAELTPEQARRIVGVLAERGLLAESIGKSSYIPFVTWLRQIYDHATSPFIQEKIAHKRSFGKTVAGDRLQAIKKHYEPYFQDRLLSEISRADLKSFSFALAEKGLNPATINRILTVSTVPLKWAFRNDLIIADPTKGVMFFSESPKKRGILTKEEARALFAVHWKDQRAFVANKLASETGLRAGEIRALRLEDIKSEQQGDFLDIQHSYSNIDGLKAPKNGEPRKVPLLTDSKRLLLELVKMSPHKKGEYIFFGPKPDRPADDKVFNDGLIEALAAIGIDKSARKARAISLHSWRHFYSSILSDMVDARSLGLVTGHKTPAVLAVYAAHANAEHVDLVRAATVAAFGRPGDELEAARRAAETAPGS